MLWLRGNPRNGSWLPSCEFAESDDKLPCPNGSVPWVENTFGSFGNLTEQVLPDKALSFTFLLLWLSGDTANLIGCLLTDQLALQKYTAVYYVSMDSVMISQFLYYKFKNRRSAGTRSMNCLALVCLVGPLGWLFGSAQSRPETPLTRGPSRSLLFIQPLVNVEVVTGYVCGSLSCLLYLGSRLPQLNKNFQRKSTDGVSPIMFMLVVMGNLAYGLDILLKQPQTESEGCYILRHLPWIIGSLGTLSLDICISTQFILYRKPLVTSDEPKLLLRLLNHILPIQCSLPIALLYARVHLTGSRARLK
uniref:Solute carrier family 66 member 1 n=1 Tax=Eptatretus burgeri TaxID=7764 RepID=A0A8C4Q3Z0_EPTBU